MPEIAFPVIKLAKRQCAKRPLEKTDFVIIPFFLVMNVQAFCFGDLSNGSVRWISKQRHLLIGSFSWILVPMTEKGNPVPASCSLTSTKMHGTCVCLGEELIVCQTRIPRCSIVLSVVIFQLYLINKNCLNI